MPGISTSSDIYQNRNQGLTTYRKDSQGPALSEEMAKRTEDRAKAARVQARQEPSTVVRSARPAVAQAKAAGNAQAQAAPTHAVPTHAAPTHAAGADTAPIASAAAPSVQTTRAAPATPAKVVHELYAPTSRTTREHDDRFSMVTGGTVDVRA